jgi:NADP-dependent 3-hydroxy acid dehydrogenase YdfG
LGGRGHVPDDQARGDPAVLTVDGDIAEAATTDRIISGALGRFGRIDTLVNNAGVYISKPFTDYTAGDYALWSASISPDSSC